LNFKREKFYKLFFNFKNPEFFFKLGVFFILSAPVIACFFFLLSIIITSFVEKDDFFRNKFNYPLLLCSSLLLASALLNTTIFRSNLIGWEQYLTWIGLANWIPLFYSYWAFQKIVSTSKSRSKIIKIFLIGSVPLFLSGFSQIWLNWHGPFRFLNNLIIWYQRPVDLNHPYNGMTSLFSNQNYAGAWLIIIWPMLLTCLFQKKLVRFKKLFIIVLILASLVAIYLTRSRSAWIGTLISTQLIINKTFSTTSFIILLLIAVSFLSINQFFPNIFYIFSKIFIPQIFLTKFSFLDLESLASYPRILIWESSIKFISERPFLGWGAGSFPILFENQGNIEQYAHTHSLILELANSYGILPSLIISVFVFYILLSSFKKIYLSNTINENLNFEKAWWASAFTLSLSQLVDIQYFDIRISITFWILLAGLTCKIRENKKI
tara:strand:- start:579 stop:1886 length:1308 start_codon:yes stop_codon:yes gene_type:complete